jgi:hypothetical protein
VSHLREVLLPQSQHQSGMASALKTVILFPMLSDSLKTWTETTVKRLGNEENAAVLREVVVGTLDRFAKVFGLSQRDKTEVLAHAAKLLAERGQSKRP